MIAFQPAVRVAAAAASSRLHDVRVDRQRNRWIGVAQPFAHDRQRHFIAQHPAGVEVSQTMERGFEPILLQQVVDRTADLVWTLVGAIPIGKQKVVLLICEPEQLVSRKRSRRGAPRNRNRPARSSVSEARLFALGRLYAKARFRFLETTLDADFARFKVHILNL